MPEIAAVKYNFINLVIISSQPLLRWIKGVSVMLEKLACNANAQNLRAILLLEANFNAFHKIIFDNRLILSVEATNTTPIEVIRGRRS